MNRWRDGGSEYSLSELELPSYGPARYQQRGGTMADVAEAFDTVSQNPGLPKQDSHTPSRVQSQRFQGQKVAFSRLIFCSSVFFIVAWFSEMCRFPG